MQCAPIPKLQELRTIIGKMPISYCSISVLPEFGVQWKEVSRAVRKSRLPMTPASVARVLCQHVAKALPEDEIADIVSRLRLKLVASQVRNWHVISLTEPTDEMSIPQLLKGLPRRIQGFLSNSKAGKNSRHEIQMAMQEDLVYISVEAVSRSSSGSVLYVCTPPGQPVALVSALKSSRLLAVVQALGYESFENAKLHGCDIKSLLRIHNRHNNENINHLSEMPEYNPMPAVTKNGNSVIIDYTNRRYTEEYVDRILGPDPPLLTDLTLNLTRPFFDPTRLRKKINVRINLKSEDIAKTLKAWVVQRTLPATSDLFKIFHEVKSNDVDLDYDD